MSFERAATLDEVAEPEPAPADIVEIIKHARIVTGRWEVVNTYPGGKRIIGALYLHRRAVPSELLAAVERIASAAGCRDFEVVKFVVSEDRISLLHYPTFDVDPFPVLVASWRIELATGAVTSRSYPTANPPVLHRKELLLPPGDLRFRDWSALTKQAENAGLFETPTAIGSRIGWERALERAGLRVSGHELIADVGDVQRHRTALVRYSLSTPMETLLRHGFLDGRFRVFDYGCGRGGDLAQLEQLGVAACGWDPHFAPSAPRTPADIVNLGFVLNVIENHAERAEALSEAWGLCQRLLVVAVLIGGRSAWEKHRLFRDGVITSRGTFQKYFSQEELRVYVERATGRQSVALAPGLFFIFRRDEDEQLFLAERHRRATPTAHLCGQRPERPPQLPKERRATPRRADRWAGLDAPINDFWESALALGRPPEPDEFEVDAKLAEAGSRELLWRHCMATFGEPALTDARARRMGDLLVWLALGCFERRRSYENLPTELRRDVRAFWGGWANAQAAGRQLLFAAGDGAALMQAAEQAAAAKVAFLDGGHALYVRGAATRCLPELLRVFIGCAGQLVGEPESADLLKLHLQGRKLTIMNYDDFGRPLPDLIERVKVDLRRADVHFFSYDDASYPPQPLLWKSRVLAEEDQERGRNEQLERSLVSLGFDLDNYIDRPTFERRLAELGWEQRGWDLMQIAVPDTRPLRHSTGD